MEIPPVRYAKTPDGLHIAHQAFGAGDRAVVFMTDLLGSIDVQWEHPGHLRVWQAQAAIARNVLFDFRGTGLSDPVPLTQFGDLERWVEDLETVMDAVGFDRAVIVGEGWSGHVAVHFAVSRPARVAALALVNTGARFTKGGGYPHGVAPEHVDGLVGAIEERWGSGRVVATVAPNLADDLAFCGRMERRSASPGVAAAAMRARFSSDVRDLLGQIPCPTLVFSTGDLINTVDHSRYLAEHITGAQFIEAPSTSFYWSDDPESMKQFNRFVAGVSEATATRQLGTVLFTDIVGSTLRAAELGDERWTDVLATVDGVVTTTIERFGGRVANTTGDGHVALFDDPEKAVLAGGAICSTSTTLDVEFRAGAHTGAIEVRPGGDVAGIVVHTAARVMASADPGRLWVTRTITDLVAGSGLEFEDRGTHELKGVPGEWQLFEVVG